MFGSVAKCWALAGALTISAGMAQAFTVTYQNSGDVFGGNGSATAKIGSVSNPSATLNVRAGGFALKGDLFGSGMKDFTAWCLDIATFMASGKNYEITGTPFSLAPNARSLSAGQIGSIASLFDTFYSVLDLADDAQSAGFQLALWEIVYETGSVLSLNSGNFTATNSAAAIARGNAYLTGLNPSAAPAWSLLFLQAAPHVSQNLVTAAPVPLPAAAGLLLLALSGLGAVARRRKPA